MRTALHVSHCSQVSVQHRHNRSCYAVLNKFKLTSRAGHTSTRQHCSVQQQQFLVQVPFAVLFTRPFIKLRHTMKPIFVLTQLTPTSAVRGTLLQNVSRSLVLFASSLVTVYRTFQQLCLEASGVVNVACYCPTNQDQESVHCPLGLRMRRTRRMTNTPADT